MLVNDCFQMSFPPAKQAILMLNRTTPFSIRHDTGHYIDRKCQAPVSIHILRSRLSRATHQHQERPVVYLEASDVPVKTALCRLPYVYLLKTNRAGWRLSGVSGHAQRGSAQKGMLLCRTCKCTALSRERWRSSLCRYSRSPQRSEV
jgi:hypothetical protein